jgi:hypothetical protein
MKTLKIGVSLLLFICISGLSVWGQQLNLTERSVKSADSKNTFCNPMNLNYRFQPTTGTSYREAADPIYGVRETRESKIYQD